MTIAQEALRGLVWLLLLLVLFIAGLVSFGIWHDQWSGYNASLSVGDGSCNIAVIPVQGEMNTTSYVDEYGFESGVALDEVEYWIKTAEEDASIKGILFVTDSPGGSPYAGEALSNDLLRTPLPTAVVVQDIAASSAYWMATGADTIIASALSSVGSIGVTASYLDRSQQNSDSGLYYVEIASGPYKDSGDPDKYLSEEEREIIQKDVDAMSEKFIQSVADHRKLSVEAVTALADGSTMLGEAALTEGLIDAIGDKETARAWFASTLQIDAEDVIFCE